MPGDDGFRFRHALIRDAAYSGVPKAVRAGLHERAAALFESQGVAGELVGYHLEQAYRYRDELGAVDDATRAIGARAGELLGAAGQRAFALEDMPAAVNLLERALRARRLLGPSRLELQRELSMALWWTGEVADAESLLDDLIATAVALGELPPAVVRPRRACRPTDDLRRRRGGRRATRRRGRRGRRCSRRSATTPASLERGVGSRTPTSCGCGMGRRRTPPELALGHAEAAGEVQEEARIIDVLCTSLLYGPTPADEAVARCVTMLEDERESRVVEANISISLAGLLAMLGRFDEARSFAERARSVYNELGQRMAVAGWTQIAGPLELLAGDPEAAERHLRLGLDLLEGAGSQGYQASLLAEALYQLGSYDEAGRFAELGLETSAAGDDAAQVIASGVRAKVQARLQPEQIDEALSTARAAAALAAATDALNLWGDSLVAVAHVLRIAERPDEAETVLRDAAAVYGRKGNVVAAEQAVGGTAQSAS